MRVKRDDELAYEMRKVGRMSPKPSKRYCVAMQRKLSYDNHFNKLFKVSKSRIHNVDAVVIISRLSTIVG